MNRAVETGLLAAALGCAMLAGRADAAVVEHVMPSNAVNYCQSFNPGPANTIRNRVIGVENAGSAPVAVACNFHSIFTAGSGSEPPHRLQIVFANTNDGGAIHVTCALLTGGPGFGVGYAVVKTTPAIPAGATAQLTWDATDVPRSGATNLGNPFIGVNCALPPGGLMGGTIVRWRQDNGI
jgi:hypothetical protein